MKIIFAFIAFSFVTSCSENIPRDNPPDFVLEQHRKFSSFTDPGKFAHLYNNLPTSLNELCSLVKKQLVHPFDVEKFGSQIPKDRRFEDRDFPTVSLMLQELLIRNENGLNVTRKPEHRLVVACVHHSMLLASILRHRGIPVRIRAGFAKYIGDRRDLRVSHVVCEVWDQEHTKWILIDPDRQRVNFLRNEFEFAHETWAYLRNNNLNKNKYVSRYKNVSGVIIHLLVHDLSYIIGDEKPYWDDPPIVARIDEGISELSETELKVLDDLAMYLKDPDMYLNDLKKIISENEFLQIKEELKL